MAGPPLFEVEAAALAALERVRGADGACCVLTCDKATKKVVVVKEVASVASVDAVRALLADDAAYVALHWSRAGGKLERIFITYVPSVFGDPVFITNAEVLRTEAKLYNDAWQRTTLSAKDDLTDAWLKEKLA
mmetsp:Transcript_21687/g.52967  ORF Transcript_21687/g.52967 Transcript_21687/m.52967 type:complete len:133 (-) Transcript_21687:19-417(-)